MSLKNSGRYFVPTNEGFEPGSNETVLKNYLKITSSKDMDIIEKQKLEEAELEVIKIFDENRQFTAQDICNIHELWLGDIYPFAGTYRTVAMSKDGFSFAAPNYIHSLMKKFEDQYLAKHTPCHYSDLDELAFAIGIVHVEFILIHPFREGNGRTARLLADLMAIQAKRPLLNFSSIDQLQHFDGFRKYISAIHAGIDENYGPIQKIFKVILEESII